MKTSLDDLAWFGGRPLFDRELAVGRPNILRPQTLQQHLQGILDRRWLTNDGPLVKQLEGRIARLLDVPHCVAVNNATIGIQVAAKALGVTGEVLVPAFTFIGTVHALSWLGLTPVFCDVRPDDHGLDPDDVLRRIGPRTGAILGVHLWGRACAVEPLQEIAERHGVPLILDAAHALACGHRGHLLGRHGAAEIFSLHATKAINGFEGGLIATTDGALAQRLRELRNFGFDSEALVVSVGINAKMNEFNAAAALSNLDGLAELCAHNRRLFEAYRRTLSGVPGVRLVEPEPGQDFTYHYAVLELDPGVAPGRDALADLLLSESVYARRYFHPGCHRGQPYAAQPVTLPVTDRLCDSLLALPTGQQLGPDDAEALGRLIRWCLQNGEAIRRRMQSQPAPA